MGNKEKEEKEKKEAVVSDATTEQISSDISSDEIISDKPQVKSEQITLDSVSSDTRDDDASITKDKTKQPVADEVTFSTTATDELTTTSTTDEESTSASEEKEVLDFSTQEMEAISQLISPNAVTSEREEFERLKAAMDTTDTLDQEEQVIDTTTQLNDIVQDSITLKRDDHVDAVIQGDDAKATIDTTQTSLKEEKIEQVITDIA